MASLRERISSPTTTWPSLRRAREATTRQFGDDARLFFFWRRDGEDAWRRTLIHPNGLDEPVPKGPGVTDRGVFLVPKREPLVEIPSSGSRPKGKSGQDDQELLARSFKRGRGYLYHVTSSPSYLRIRKTGLLPGASEGIAVLGPGLPTTGYEDYAKSNVFLTDATGVEFWLAMQGPSARKGESVLLRTKDPKCTMDAVGSTDASRWVGKPSMAYRCARRILPSALEVWDMVGKRWRPVSKVRLVTSVETIDDLSPNPSPPRRQLPSQATAATAFMAGAGDASLLADVQAIFSEYEIAVGGPWPDEEAIGREALARLYDAVERWEGRLDTATPADESLLADSEVGRLDSRLAAALAVCRHRNPKEKGHPADDWGFLEQGDAPTRLPHHVYEEAVGSYSSAMPPSLVLRPNKLPPRLADALRNTRGILVARTPTGQGAAFTLSWFVDLPSGVKGIGATNTIARALRNALIPRRDLPASEVALHQAPLYLYDHDNGIIVRFDAPPR